LECSITIAIHKDVVGEHAHLADHSTPEPQDGVTRFGPGSLVNLFEDTGDLWYWSNCLEDLVHEGLLDRKKGVAIFKAQGGAK
jgi:hypothetical protein